MRVELHGNARVTLRGVDEAKPIIHHKELLVPPKGAKRCLMFKEILAQLGTTSVVVAAAVFLMKTWLTHQLERLKTQNSHTLSLKLEEIRADWAKDVARLNVREGCLHENV